MVGQSDPQRLAATFAHANPTRCHIHMSIAAQRKLSASITSGETFSDPVKLHSSGIARPEADEHELEI